MIYTTIFVGAFFAGIPWGILGVASAYAIVTIPINLAGFWLALRLVNLELVDLWRTLRTPPPGWAPESRCCVST